MMYNRNEQEYDSDEKLEDAYDPHLENRILDLEYPPEEPLPPREFPRNFPPGGHFP